MLICLVQEVVWVSFGDVIAFGCCTQSLPGQGHCSLFLFQGILQFYVSYLHFGWLKMHFCLNMLSLQHPSFFFYCSNFSSVLIVINILPSWGQLFCVVKTGMLELWMDSLSSNHHISQNVYCFWQTPSGSRKANLCAGSVPCIHTSPLKGGVNPAMNWLTFVPSSPGTCVDPWVSSCAPEAAPKVLRRIAG